MNEPKPGDLDEFAVRLREALAALDKRVAEEMRSDEEFWRDFARRHSFPC